MKFLLLLTLKIVIIEIIVGYSVKLNYVNKPTLSVKISMPLILCKKCKVEFDYEFDDYDTDSNNSDYDVEDDETRVLPIIYTKQFNDTPLNRLLKTISDEDVDSTNACNYSLKCIDNIHNYKFGYWIIPIIYKDCCDLPSNVEHLTTYSDESISIEDEDESDERRNVPCLDTRMGGWVLPISNYKSNQPMDKLVDAENVHIVAAVSSSKRESIHESPFSQISNPSLSNIRRHIHDCDVYNNDFLEHGLVPVKEAVRTSDSYSASPPHCHVLPLKPDNYDFDDESLEDTINNNLNNAFNIDDLSLTDSLLASGLLKTIVSNIPSADCIPVLCLNNNYNEETIQEENSSNDDTSSKCFVDNKMQLGFVPAKGAIKITGAPIDMHKFGELNPNFRQWDINSHFDSLDGIFSPDDIIPNHMHVLGDAAAAEGAIKRTGAPINVHKFGESNPNFRQYDINSNFEHLNDNCSPEDVIPKHLHVLGCAPAKGTVNIVGSSWDPSVLKASSPFFPPHLFTRNHFYPNDNFMEEENDTWCDDDERFNEDLNFLGFVPAKGTVKIVGTPVIAGNVPHLIDKNVIKSNLNHFNSEDDCVSPIDITSDDIYFMGTVPASGKVTIVGSPIHL